MDTPFISFERIVHTNGNCIAIQSKNTKYSYNELYNRILEVSSTLIEYGIKKGDKVSIHIANSAEFVIYLFALAKIMAVPIAFDPNLPANQIEKVLKKYKIGKHIGPRNILGKFSPVTNVLNFNNDYYIFQSREPKPHFNKMNTWGIVLFTSGTISGVPKPVFKQWQKLAIEFQAYQKIVKLDTNDKVLCFPPFYHAYGLMCGVIPALLAGATLYVGNINSTSKNLQMLLSESIPTIVIAIPYLIDIFCRFHIINSNFITNLRYCFSAGAPLLVSTAQKFKELTGIFPSNLYGSTETGTISIDFDFIMSEKYCSAGKPIDCIKCTIVDDDKRELENGSMGEVIISGTSVCSEYIGDQSIRNNQCDNEIYYSGDIGLIDDNGNLQICGRKKDLINVSGEKINPLIIEEVLLEHPDVEKVAVLGVEDRYSGERVKAFIIASKNLNDKDIFSYCRKRLSMPQIPKEIVFVDNFPTTSTGKILKSELKNV